VSDFIFIELTRQIENPVLTLEGTNLVSPSSNAASFVNVLDIILSTQNGELYPTIVRDLRLVCKSTRFLVDSHVSMFEYSKEIDDVQVEPDICNLAPWPWPNVSIIRFFPQRPFKKQILQKDVQYLATLPLLKLECLSLSCVSVLPLVDCHFPKLTALDLTILRDAKELDSATCPRNLEFPRWSLKKLGIEVEADPSDKTSDNISFLGPLLKSCVELTELRFGHGNCTKVIADMIISASLPRLESLAVGSSHFSTDFYPTLFSRDWPALKRFRLQVPRITNGTLSLLASQSWIKQLEHVTISLENCIDADELHTFLKALESGVVEELKFFLLFPFSLEKFKGIKLERLKSLELGTLAFCEETGEGNFDGSAFLNMHFESCTFPNLEKIFISNGPDGDHEVPLRWITPPRTNTRNLIASFPKLEGIRLEQVVLFQDVAHYLGNFRKQTGCQLGVYNCQFVFEETKLVPLWSINYF